MYQRWEDPPTEFSVILSHKRQDLSRGGPGQRRTREDGTSNSVDDGPLLCLLTLFPSSKTPEGGALCIFRSFLSTGREISSVI